MAMLHLLRRIRQAYLREAMLTYQQGLEACKFQYLEMTHYFHVVEASQKQLFDLRLGHAAYEYIEQDFVHMLEPPERFEALIEEGEYLYTRDPALLIRYSSDVAFYKTTLNNTNLFLARQRELGHDLVALIHARYRQIEEP